MHWVQGYWIYDVSGLGCMGVFLEAIQLAVQQCGLVTAKIAVMTCHRPGGVNPKELLRSESCLIHFAPPIQGRWGLMHGIDSL